MRITEHFSLAEATRTSTGLPNNPDKVSRNYMTALAETLLEPIRDLLGTALIIHSLFRCRAVNTAVGGDKNSAHLMGRACDFHPKGWMIRQAFDCIRTSDLPYDKLILERKDNSWWIHVQIPKEGAKPRRKAYIANVTDTGTAYREV